MVATTNGLTCRELLIPSSLGVRGRAGRSPAGAAPEGILAREVARGLREELVWVPQVARHLHRHHRHEEEGRLRARQLPAWASSGRALGRGRPRACSGSATTEALSRSSACGAGGWVCARHRPLRGGGTGGGAGGGTGGGTGGGAGAAGSGRLAEGLGEGRALGDMRWRVGQEVGQEDASPRGT